MSSKKNYFITRSTSINLSFEDSATIADIGSANYLLIASTAATDVDQVSIDPIIAAATTTTNVITSGGGTDSLNGKGFR